MARNYPATVVKTYTPVLRLAHHPICSRCGTEDHRHVKDVRTRGKCSRRKAR